MRSSLVLFALVAAVSSTAILRQPVKEEATKDLAKEVKVHQKPKGTCGLIFCVRFFLLSGIENFAGWYVKFYFDTFVATGKANVLDGMFCKLCTDLIDVSILRLYCSTIII